MSDQKSNLIVPRAGLFKRLQQALTYTFTGEFFAPNRPLPATHQDAAGRRFDYPLTRNIQSRPIRDSGITFETLRGYAEVFDWFRIILETRKDQVEAFDWSIVPRDQSKKRKIDGETQARIDSATEFFRHPATDMNWQTWLRSMLEDHFVLDAICLWPVYEGTKLVACETIDPATVMKFIDYSGRTPQPPLPAFAQSIKGVPTAYYQRDELYYFIRNARSMSIDGKSILEQILMTVNIALRREQSQLAYFTEGNMPEGIMSAPEGWTPDQIRDFQEWFDAYTSIEERVGSLRMVPFADKVQMLRHGEAVLKNEFDEWLIRIICYAFSVSPLPFVKMMNRSSSETADDTAKEEGLMPFLQFLKSIMNKIIQDGMKFRDLEFSWSLNSNVDAETQLKTDEFDVEHGVLSIDDVRERRGLERLGVPPMIFTQQNGPIPVSMYIDGTAPGLAAVVPPEGGDPQKVLKRQGADAGSVVPFRSR